MLADKFIKARWNILSDEIKMEIAIRLLGDKASFSNIIAETGMDRRVAHSAQNRLMDLGYIEADGGRFKRIGNGWKRVPTIIPKSENEFLDALIPELMP